MGKDRGKIKFDALGMRTRYLHHITFGPKRSKRILRHAFGTKSCNADSKSRKVVVKLRFSARLGTTASSKAKRSSSKARLSQRRRSVVTRRVTHTPCFPSPVSGCLDAPGLGSGQDDGQSAGQGDEQGAVHGPTQPGNSGADGDDSGSTQCTSSGSDYSQRSQIGTVVSGDIDEASGLATSRKNSQVLWLHNDSGDAARLYAINTQGQLLATYTISGASAVDWEDMAIGPGPDEGVDYLYIGDIGDNSAVRGSVTVYRVAEPVVSSSQSAQTGSLPVSDSIQLSYPDGARDAETLMVDPQNGDMYVVSKREALSRIYRLTDEQWSDPSATLEYRGVLTWGGAVGGDISRSGDEVLVKSYLSVYRFDRPDGTDLWDALTVAGTTLPYTAEPQGEAVAYCGRGSGYFTLSEGLNQPLYYYW